MAISLDSVNSTTADATTMTASLTVGNHTNRILVCLVTVGNVQSVHADSVKFNTTESFTYIEGSLATDDDDQSVEAWYLVNPTVTTANVVLDWAGSASPDGHFTVWSLYGVDTSDPIGAVDTLADFGDDAPSINNSITTESDNSWVLQAIGMGIDDYPRFTAASGQTERYDDIGGSGGGTYTAGAFDLLVSSAGATNINLTDESNGGDYSCQVAVEIQAAAGAATVVKDVIGNGIIPSPR